MQPIAIIESNLHEAITIRNQLSNFIQLYLNKFTDMNYFKYIHDVFTLKYDKESICQYFYQTLEKGIQEKKLTPQQLSIKNVHLYFFNKVYRGNRYIKKYPYIFNYLNESVEKIKSNYKNIIVCDPLIKTHFDNPINNKEPLLDAIVFYKLHTNQKRHMEFIYYTLFPLYSLNEWESYLYETIKKSIDIGNVSYNEINLTVISKYIFNADYHSGRWSEKYPELYELLQRCIDKVKASGESIKKYKHINSDVKDLFIYALTNKTSLIKAINLYKIKDGNTYMSYIETTLIPEYGEENFLKYVEEIIYDLCEKERLNICQVYPPRISKYIFNIDCNESKWTQRHEKLYNLIIMAIENTKIQNSSFSLKDKLKKFEKLNETEIQKLSILIIENEFFKKRVRLNKTKFYRILLDSSNIKISSLTTFKYYTTIDHILKENYKEQRLLFISSNKDELDFKKDKWILFYEDGASLRSKTFDFNSISSPTVATELKIYIKNNYIYTDIDKLFHTFYNSRRILNFLLDKFQINYLKDLKDYHAGIALQCLQVENYAVISMKNSFVALSNIINYFINLKEYPYKPEINIFSLVMFHNASAMSKNTDYIPNEVLNQIELHIDELNPVYQLMYNIFSFTGLRAKEVTRLEYDCCNSKEEYEGFYKLEYIPHKILKARRLRSLPDKNFVYISYNLYNEIQKQCENSKLLREKHNTPFIFITESNGDIASKGNTGFCRSINKLIKKYSICDLEGNLWHFTSKQMRKTLAVELIENDATTHQVATQLGHLSSSTTQQFYIEVKMKKIAELNTDFFYKKFKIAIGEENLKLYSEEERRQLYIDFCLNKREVEFGQCTKHMSEGKCNKRTGKSNCAICSKLCTGIKYLSKWESLQLSQQNIVTELIAFYKKNNITDYSDFVEYKREKFLLDCYTEVINKIKNTNCE